MIIQKFKTVLAVLSLLMAGHSTTAAVAQSMADFANEIKDENAPPDLTSDGIGIVTGSKQQAINYHSRNAQEICINFATTSMDDFIKYLGYPASVKSRDIETIAALSDFPTWRAPNTISELAPGMVDKSSLTSEAGKFLLASQEKKGGVRTATFFAPKIVNYAKASGIHDPGWRKLVWLPSLASSNKPSARACGMKGAYVLFNYVHTGDPKKDPLLDAQGRPAASANNQVILMPNFKDGSYPSKEHRQGAVNTAYFAVFSGLNRSNPSLGYQPLTFLAAGFDIPQDGGLKEYSVPNACAHCHGHDTYSERGGPKKGTQLYPYIKPNYIDTDNLYDAMALDFKHVETGPYSEPILVKKRPLRNGAKFQVQLPEYKERFKVIRELNKQMLDESMYALRGDNSDSHQIASASIWMNWHGENSLGALNSRTPEFRGYGFYKNAAGEQIPWQTSNADHRTVINTLNQYCFRCHSTILYSVFDIGAVVKKMASIKYYVESGDMPYGRSIPEKEKKCFLGALASFKDLVNDFDCDAPESVPKPAAQPPAATPPPSAPTPPPASQPQPLPPDEEVEAIDRTPGSVTFRVEAGYVARMDMIYMQNNLPFFKTTGNVSLGFSETLDIPGDATAITINGYMISAGAHEIFSETIPHPRGNVCKKVWGTIFSQGHGPC